MEPASIGTHVGMQARAAPSSDGRVPSYTQPLMRLPQYQTFDTTLAVSSAGAGMYGWTDSSFYGHGAALPTLRIVVVD